MPSHEASWLDLFFPARNATSMSEDSPSENSPPKPLSLFQLLGLVLIFFLFGSVLSHINLFGPKEAAETDASTAQSNVVAVVSNALPVAVETNRP